MIHPDEPVKHLWQPLTNPSCERKEKMFTRFCKIGLIVVAAASLSVPAWSAVTDGGPLSQTSLAGNGTGNTAGMDTVNARAESPRMPLGSMTLARGGGAGGGAGGCGGAAGGSAGATGSGGGAAGGSAGAAGGSAGAVGGMGASVGPGPGAAMGGGDCDGTGVGANAGMGAGGPSGHGPGDGMGFDGNGPMDGTGFGAADH
jgi:hypothetical protein